MKTLLPLLLLPALALAAFPTSKAVLTTATLMTTASPVRQGTLVENKGTASIFCSSDSAVTTSTGFTVEAGAQMVFPSEVLYCIAAVAQAGTGTDRTMVWESP